MSKKRTIEIATTSETIGVILLDLPATRLPVADMDTWNKFLVETYGVGLLEDTIYCESLSPPYYTLWGRNLYERT